MSFNEKMFGNIGGKFKTVAKVFTWLMMIASVIYGIVLAVNGAFFIGILMAVLLALAVWLAAIPFYGFGELIETNQSLVRSNWEIVELLKQKDGSSAKNNGGTTPDVNQASYAPMTEEEKKEAEKSDRLAKAGWKCTCGQINPSFVRQCTCGAYRPE